MNIPETDLSIIVKTMESGPPEAAFPSLLDDAILHQIARDLRLIEFSSTVDNTIKPPIAGPMYLIFQMMLSQSGKTKGKPSLQLAEDRFQHWLQRYMYYIEREVVSRAIKMPCHFDSSDLLAEIREEFDL